MAVLNEIRFGIRVIPDGTAVTPTGPDSLVSHDSIGPPNALLAQMIPKSGRFYSFGRANREMPNPHFVNQQHEQASIPF